METQCLRATTSLSTNGETEALCRQRNIVRFVQSREPSPSVAASVSYPPHQILYPTLGKTLLRSHCSDPVLTTIHRQTRGPRGRRKHWALQKGEAGLLRFARSPHVQPNPVTTATAAQNPRGTDLLLIFLPKF